MATSSQNKQAIILAGGFGTRLRAVVPDLPKPLAPVAGRPFLAWVLDSLAAQDFGTVVLSVGYRHEMIAEAVGESWQQMQIRYAVEDAPLGTGGAIRHALSATSADTLFVLNGDTYLELDTQAMAARHAAVGAPITLAAVPVDDIDRYGGLDVSDDGRVRRFLEKGGHGPGLINGGTYLIARSLFETFDLPSRFSFETDILQAHVAQLAPCAFVTHGRFIDMGIPEDYARAQSLFGHA